MAFDDFRYQTSNDGLIVIEFPSAIVAEGSDGQTGQLGPAFCEEYGFRPMKSGQPVENMIAADRIRIVTSDDSAAVTIEHPGRSHAPWVLNIAHADPEWAQSALEDGATPMILSIGGALLPGLNDVRLDREIAAEAVWGGIVVVTRR